MAWKKKRQVNLLYPNPCDQFEMEIRDSHSWTEIKFIKIEGHLTICVYISKYIVWPGYI